MLDASVWSCGVDPWNGWAILGPQDKAEHQGDDSNDNGYPERLLKTRRRTRTDNRSSPGESERNADSEAGIADPRQRPRFVVGSLDDAQRAESGENHTHESDSEQERQRDDNVLLIREDGEQRGDCEGAHDPHTQHRHEADARPKPARKGCRQQLDYRRRSHEQQRRPRRGGGKACIGVLRDGGHVKITANINDPMHRMVATITGQVSRERMCSIATNGCAIRLSTTISATRAAMPAPIQVSAAVDSQPAYPPVRTTMRIPMTANASRAAPHDDRPPQPSTGQVGPGGHH
jgi:hypothetical protein